MSLLLALVVGWAAAELAAGRVGVPPVSIGLGVTLAAWQPAVATLLGIAWWARRLRAGRVGRRRSKVAADGDVVVLAEMVGLGLSAGLTFRTASEAAAGEVHPLLGDEVNGVLRRSRRTGLETALAVAEGRAAPLYRLAARAAASGAPVGEAVAGLVNELRRAQRARALESIRRLPVRLLLPLALLILPGFVLLTLGPALLAGLERLTLTLPTVVGRLPT